MKRAAAAAGFDLCGIAVAESGTAERDHLPEWLAHGYHGAMKYMERRRDVRELLDGCQSVIALGLNYFQPNATEGSARVSRYASGEDYHQVVGLMQDALVRDLRTALPGERFSAYCDTGPLLERAWAQRAGLGWIGKNGCLITSSHGSWVFLAVILTTARLEPDRPHADRCGTCERCLTRCPTDAFPQPRVVDARRCISYLTIEQWKPIPPRFRIAPWAFGCDVCQEVCPWNRHAKPCSVEAFTPREVEPDLARWIRMGKQEFHERYGDTALARPGRRGLARNALAVLRESGIDASLLQVALEDRSTLVRDQASAAAAELQEEQEESHKRGAGDE